MSGRQGASGGKEGRARQDRSGPHTVKGAEGGRSPSGSPPPQRYQPPPGVPTGPPQQPGPSGVPVPRPRARTGTFGKKPQEAKGAAAGFPVPRPRASTLGKKPPVGAAPIQPVPRATQPRTLPGAVGGVPVAHRRTPSPTAPAGAEGGSPAGAVGGSPAGAVGGSPAGAVGGASAISPRIGIGSQINVTPEPPRRHRPFHMPEHKKIEELNRLHRKTAATKDPHGYWKMDEKGYVLGQPYARSRWSRFITYNVGQKKSAQVCIRLADKQRLEPYLQVCLANEVSTLKTLSNNACVIRTLDTFYMVPTGQFVFVQEWIHNNLLEWVIHRQRVPVTPESVKYKHGFVRLPSGLDLRTVKLWMGQVAKAIEYLHTKGVVHNRIEPNSIMIRGRESAVIGHFLCAQYYHGYGGNKLPPVQCLNLSYVSPDIFANMANIQNRYDAKENDKWGFYCTCAFVLCGRDLFSSMNQGTIPQQQQRVLDTLEQSRWPEREFLKSLFAEPFQDIEAILAMPWFLVMSVKDPNVPHPKSPAASPALSLDDSKREKTFHKLGHVSGNVYTLMANEGYALQYLIGQGGYGAVYAGTKKEGHNLMPAAMKMIGGFNKKHKWHYRLSRYVNEMKVMSRLKHPNLVEVLDIFLDDNTHGRNFERRAFIWMERARTDLGKMYNESPGYRLPAPMEKRRNFVEKGRVSS